MTEQVQGIQGKRKISRRDFLKLAGGAVLTGASKALVTVLPSVLAPLNDGDKAAILTKSISEAYETSRQRMSELMPYGWRPSAVTGSMDVEGEDLLRRLSPGVSEIGAEIETLEKVDRSKAEIHVAKVVDGVSGWRDFNDPSLWYLRCDGTNRTRNGVGVAKIPLNSKPNGVDVLTVDGVPISDPLMGGIERIDEAYVAPSGKVIGVGKKVLADEASDQKSLFIFDPSTGKVATVENEFIADSIEGHWVTTDGLDNSGDVVVFHRESNNGDNNTGIILSSIGTSSDGKWVTHFKNISIPKEVQKKLGLRVGSSGQPNILSIPAISAQTTYNGRHVSGFVEVEVADGVDKKRSCVVSLDDQELNIVKHMEKGEEQKIIGRMGPLTIISHTRKFNNEQVGDELLGVSFLVSDESSGNSIAQATMELDAPYKLPGKFNLNKFVTQDGSTYIECTGEDGNLIFRKQLTFLDRGLQMPVNGVREVVVKHDMNHAFPEEEYKWEADGNTEKVRVDPNTVFVYVPGAGGTVTEDLIMNEMGWESTLHKPIFNAKFGKNGEVMYQSYSDEMRLAQNYEEMMTVMEKYGVFFIPWNMVVTRDGETSFDAPNLNMTLQAFRIINTLKNKDVVLVGHSKGAVVVQEMLKMVQDDLGSELTGSSRIVSAVMYGRIVPPKEFVDIFSNELYKFYDFDVKQIETMVELGELSTGIDRDKLSKKGIRAVDIYDPRDPVRFTPRTLKELLNGRGNGSWFSWLGKILKFHAQKIRDEIDNMDFTPFPTTITRTNVPQEKIDENFNAYFNYDTGSSGGSSITDYHSSPDWQAFIPAIFEHVEY